jgi:hypothetical protein
MDLQAQNFRLPNIKIFVILVHLERGPKPNHMSSKHEKFTGARQIFFAELLKGKI